MVEKYKIFCKQQGEKFYFRRGNFGKIILRAKLQAEKFWEKKTFQVCSKYSMTESRQIPHCHYQWEIIILIIVRE